MNKQSYIIDQVCLAERTASLVEGIAQPLFKCLHMNHFAYVKFFANGQILRLSTSVEWTKKYLGMELYKEVNFQHPQIQNIITNGASNFLKVGKPEGKFNNALYEHNIWNSLTIAKGNADAVETWCFGADRSNEKMIDFYLNNISTLNHFILYFMDRAHKIITAYSDEDLIHTNNTSETANIQITQDVGEFLAQTNIKKYWIGIEQYLSSREVECLGHLLKGKSVKLIAKQLNLSARTVETHIKNIKQKLGCNFKSELIEKVSHYNLGSLLPQDLE